MDYDRAFSATLRGTSFRTLLAIASEHGLSLEQMDVTNAFTQADIDGVEIFVDPPPGYATYDSSGKPKPIKLKKALYGTKQASRLWQQELRRFLVDKQGFTQSVSEPCLYSKESANGHRIIVAVYVDDIIVAYANQFDFESFKKDFMRKFRSKHLGPLEWFLGVAIEKKANGYHMHQTKYINDLINRYAPDRKEYAFGRANDVPLSAEKLRHLSGPKDDAERERVKRLPYLSLVGALLYLGVMSRPDIMVYLCVLCKYMGNPSEDCYSAAMEVLLYVGRTKHLSIKYSKRDTRHRNIFSSPADQQKIEPNSGIHTFSDSSWGVAFPICGYGVFMAGGIVSYSSRLLKIVANSSCEAEYAAASLASQELRFIRNLLDDIGFPIIGPIVLAVDNTSAIDTATDVGVTKRNKHFDRALHYIRDEVFHLRVSLTFMPTHLQLADIFTKGLDRKPFCFIRGYLFRT